MQRIRMKARLLSVLVAALAFAVLSSLAVVTLRGLRERSTLESRNDCERTINALLSSLRHYEDFGSAVENTTALSEKIVGIGIYDSGGGLLYSWGAAPATRPASGFEAAGEANLMAEMYVENAANKSLIVLLQPQRPPQPPPGETAPPETPPPARPDERHGESSFMSGTLRNADLIQVEIRQPGFWREQRLYAALLPVVVALLAVLVAFVSVLVVKNVEYRANMERQKNLVLLGTAASTLAHEIKNPLLAIRLQTGILSRTLPGEGKRELAIIDDEVNRLSVLTHRVNDILRDPTGQPRRVDPLDIAEEVSARLCGRPIARCRDGADAAARTVLIDPERLRSMLENLMRNALESGGSEDGIAVEIAAGGGQVFVDVLDRGTGVPAKDREQAFDPFFTTKSRGTGIGLAICRRFAQAARGNVLLEDRAGGGTRARIVLPRGDA
jgi:two-component system sensor histidine kinase HydH